MEDAKFDPAFREWRGPSAAGIDPKRTALLVIDMQIGFLTEGYPTYNPRAADTLGRVNTLLAAFRGAGAHIVFTRHTVVDEKPWAPPSWQWEDPFFRAAFECLRPGAPGHALHDALDIRPSDQIIDKHRFSAFLPNSSALDADLRAKGIDTIVILGTITNICCESSARDAHMLDYEVIVAADANSAPDEKDHNASLKIQAEIFAVVKTTAEIIGKIIA